MKKILFIDDEINGISFNEAQNLGKEFFDQLRDFNDPLRTEITDFIKDENLDIDFPENGEISEKFFQDNILFGDLNHFLRAKENESLNSIFTKHDFLICVPDIVRAAFSDTNQYELTCSSTLQEYRNADLNKFDLVILDWYLGDGNKSNTFIKEEFANQQNSPPIILITSHEGILDSENRFSFYSDTKIGSSLLTILIKRDVQEEYFRSNGLRQLSEKAIAQRGFGNKFKQYIVSWEKAFKEAAQKSLNNLWQLDGYIVKNIHEDALLDSQPFDEHFNNFILLNHLSNIESENDLNNIANDLDAIIKELQFNDSLNFHSNCVSIENHRNLLHQYYYKGGDLPKIIDDEETFRNNILKIFPVGSIIGKYENNTIAKAFVNITQPCNLSNYARNPNSDNSIFLMKLTVLPADINHNKPFDSKTFTIKSLKVENKFYDFKPEPCHILSLPCNDIHKKIINDDYKVIGILRPEFILSLQEAAASNLTKPSQKRIERPCFGMAKLYFFPKQNNGNANLQECSYKLDFFSKNKEKNKEIFFLGRDAFRAAHFISTHLNRDDFKSDIYTFFCSNIELKKNNDLFPKSGISIGVFTNSMDNSNPTSKEQILRKITESSLKKDRPYIVIDYEEFIEKK